jgi:hypothetical protein
MNRLVFIFLLIFFQNCFAFEYFCEFEKKVDAISFVDSSEIENSTVEENQAILNLINHPLKLKVNKHEIKQFVKVGGDVSILTYKVVKDDGYAVTAINIKKNFILFFGHSDLKLVFFEIHDAGHVANYFYFCKK